MMPKLGRALLVGVHGKDIRGAEYDVRSMAALFEDLDFSVSSYIGATRSELLAAYDALIAAAEPDEPAVFYYSGHGFAAEHASRTWQGICPADYHATVESDFRGITSAELSIKLAQLTRRTKNATVILDCCHAGRMSRGPLPLNATIKAVDPRTAGFAEHLAWLRAAYGDQIDAVDPVGNPDAVRLVACEQEQVAFDYEQDGLCRSAFTEALLAVLRDAEGLSISWTTILAEVRRRVLRKFTIQRPDVEGPAQRQPFSLHEVGASDAVAIDRDVEGIKLRAGVLHGVSDGDVYGVMPAGARAYDPCAAIAEVSVGKASATSARTAVRRWIAGSELPREAIAFPIVKHAPRWPVYIDADDARAQLEAAVLDTRILRLADRETALATLRLRAGVLTIEDSHGPLFRPVPFRDQLAATVKNLANLGAAQALRELAGQHSLASNDVAVDWGTVIDKRCYPMSSHGSELGLRDRIYVRVANRSPKPRYLHIFNIGLRGKVTLLTSDVPGGVRLIENAEYVLGRRALDDQLLGVRLSWPDGLPSNHARLDEVLLIFTEARANLRALETFERTAIARGKAKSADRFAMKRLSYFLQPCDMALRCADRVTEATLHESTPGCSCHASP